MCEKCNKSMKCKTCGTYNKVSCNCEINNNLIEKICINCNKPVINCSYSRNDNEIISEHSINYFTST